MAANTSREPVQAKSRYSFIFLLGLLALGAGFVLLLLSFKNRGLRPVGAGMLLFGVVLAGGYLTHRVIPGIYVDPLAYEPPWAKIGRGEGLPDYHLPASRQPPRLRPLPSTS